MVYWISETKANNFDVKIDTELQCKTGLICGINIQFVYLKAVLRHTLM